MASKGTEIKMNWAFHPGEMLQEKLQEENMSVGDFANRAAVM